MSETIELKYPIQSDGKEIKALHLRRVRVLDLEVMEQEKTQLAKSVRLLSQLTDIPPADIKRLDAADFNRASDVVEGFLD